MSDKVSKIEKQVIVMALLTSAIHLGLIAFAAIRLGIGVPGCVTNVRPFTSGSLTKIGPKRYEVHVLAKMWSFEPSRLRLPAGSVVDFFVTSKDVTHGFHIEKTNVNLNAIPNVVGYAQARFNNTGSYSIICHEYCGSGHQAMTGFIDVKDDLTDAEADGLSTPEAAEASNSPGKNLLAAKGCIACHSFDGTKMIGPTFKGLLGREEEMEDGSKATVDEAYIREMILEPNKRHLKGFNPVMPKLPVSEQEISDIVDFIKTLR